MYPRNDGLGLSLLIYLAVMLCGLALAAVLAYDAFRPNVIRNASVQSFDWHEYRAAFNRYHFLRLKEHTIVTPKELARVDTEEKLTIAHVQQKQAALRHPVPVRATVRVARSIQPPPAPSRPPPPPRSSLAEIGTQLGLPRLFALF